MKPAICKLLFLFIGAGLAAGQTDYVTEIEKWRLERETNLKKESSWLAVAGLFWLKEGTNTVGAGGKFDVRLTDNFKGSRFGQIDFQSGKAVLKVDGGVEAQIDGKSVTGPVELISDEQGKPTEIRTGTQTFFLIRRDERFGIRLKDSNSEARRNFTGLQWFPIDESYKVKARLEPGAATKELKVPNVLGGYFKMKSPGRLKFRLAGKEHSLQAVEGGDGTLSLIFGDETNENATYKAGRFLDADKAVNGETVLDFNKAYSPPCAFTPYATCPLPPEGNRLAVEIKAGEKFSGH